MAILTSRSSVACLLLRMNCSSNGNRTAIYSEIVVLSTCPLERFTEAVAVTIY